MIPALVSIALWLLGMTALYALSDGQAKWYDIVLWPVVIAYILIRAIFVRR